MYQNMPVTIFISIALVLVTTAIFYEILGIVLRIVARHDLRNRPLMFFLVVAIFSAHTIAVWIYGTSLLGDGTFIWCRAVKRNRP